MTEASSCNLTEWLARACTGDTAAFAAIVRAHERSVFSLAARMLLDAHEAEDLAQEVFLQLHRNLTNIKSDAHLGFWLRQVTARKSIDRLRQRPKHETELSEAEDIATEVPTEDHLLGRQLRMLVGKLPESARVVVLLRFQEDLDPTEIADVLDMPINTVKSHLKRSLATLREWVASEPDLGLRKSERAT